MGARVGGEIGDREYPCAFTCPVPRLSGILYYFGLGSDSLYIAIRHHTRDYKEVDRSVSCLEHTLFFAMQAQISPKNKMKKSLPLDHYRNESLSRDRILLAANSSTYGS